MKPDLVQVIAVIRFVQEIVADRNLIRGVLNTQHQTVACAAGHHISNRYAFAQLQHIQSARAGIMVIDSILAVAFVEHIGVVACTAIQDVVAKAASKRIIAFLAIEQVCAITTQQHIITSIAIQQVVTGAAIKGIITGAACDSVVAAQAADAVITQVANEGVVPLCTSNHLLLHQFQVPCCTVMKPDLVQVIAVIRFVQEIVADRNLIRGVLNTQHQTVACAAGHHISNRYAFAQLQHIQSARAGIMVIDSILAVAFVEHIGVVACTAIQDVVAKAASKRIIAFLAIEQVCAITTQQHIITSIAIQQVVTGAAIKGIITGAACDGVVAAKAADAVIAQIACERIVTLCTGKHFLLHQLQVPYRTVMKSDLVEVMTVTWFVIKIVIDCNLVVRVFKTQYQIIPYAAGKNIGNRYILTKLQCIQTTHAGIVVVDDILTISLVEHIGVAACPAIQNIVAYSTAQGVVAVIAQKFVMAT